MHLKEWMNVWAVFDLTVVVETNDSILNIKWWCDFWVFYVFKLTSPLQKYD